MIKVFLPYRTRKIFDLPVEVSAEGNNLRNLIEFLDKKYPGLKQELVDEEKLKPTISAVIDGRTTRLGLIQKLENVSEIHFLPSIAGG
tara:strand:- start:1083 stop:1346 length:264 start_codon:yes stop_codon:yes gene_type:complete